jgi:hypothetical protein
VRRDLELSGMRKTSRRRESRRLRILICGKEQVGVLSNSMRLSRVPWRGALLNRVQERGQDRRGEWILICGGEDFGEILVKFN